MIQAGNSFSIPGIAKKSSGEHRLALGRKTSFSSKLISHLIFMGAGLCSNIRAFLEYWCHMKPETKAPEAFFPSLSWKQRLQTGK